MDYSLVFRKTRWTSKPGRQRRRFLSLKCMRGILERAKANAAELELASWQVACITCHFTGIYACRSQGHFAVSLVARQGATCMECTVRQRHGQRPFCKEVRLMTQKSGAWGRKAHGLSCVKKEGETRAAYGSQVDQKTTGTDRVTWLHLQHTQGLGLLLFLKETSASCGGEWLTQRPTARASWMRTRSPPHGGALLATLGGMSQWALRCPNGRKEAWWTSSSQRLVWMSFSAEKRTGMTFLVCVHVENLALGR